MRQDRRTLCAGRIIAWAFLLGVLWAAWDATAQSGPSVAWGTYLGGTDYDVGRGIAADSDGNVYVTGVTDSSGWVGGGGDITLEGGRDAYVVKLNTLGQHQWSTYLGGTDEDCGWGIAVDSSGNYVYATGETSSSGWTSGGGNITLNGGQDAYVVKLSAADGVPQWSTYLGGAGSVDTGQGIAVDPSGNYVYVTGFTESLDGIINGWITTYGGGYSDGYVVQLSAAAGVCLWSSYLGGTNADQGYGVTVDSNGDVYVTGQTYSAGWVLGGGDTVLDGGSDGYVVKFSATGTHLWSTYLGGSAGDSGTGIAVDANGGVYVTGMTESSNGWVGGGWDTSFGGAQDGYMVKLSAAAGAQLWSSYLGGSSGDVGRGIAVDSSGNYVYATGYTQSPGWVSGGWNTSQNGGAYDGFVVKLNTDGAHLWSSYLGGTNDDDSCGIAVDSSGNAYVTGETQSSGWLNGGWDVTLNDGGTPYDDGFVVKIVDNDGGEGGFLPGCFGGSLAVGSPIGGGGFALLVSAAAIVLWLSRRRRAAHA